VLGEPDNPLASIETIRQLGNSGGGDLGDLLVLFASGNHAFMRGAHGKLDRSVPLGLFSLDLPGSQGSHRGHSGILQGDPLVPGSGRYSQTDFERLVGHAKDGFVTRKDVGRFIAENLAGDPQSKVFGLSVLRMMALDLGSVAVGVGPALLQRLTGSHDDAAAAHRSLEQRFTKLLGDDNRVGSVGEFGLLFAFFAHKPDAKTIAGEPAIAVSDLEAMFRDKRLPEGWETWKKRRIDWATNTTHLLFAAFKAHLQP
jgi:hypothetical protein